MTKQLLPKKFLHNGMFQKEIGSFAQQENTHIVKACDIFLKNDTAYKKMRRIANLLLLILCCSLWMGSSKVCAQNDDLIILANGVSFKMISVEGGSFYMGCSSEEYNCFDAEAPQHHVTLSNYYIGETEVTQALWNVVMDNNPSLSIGDNLPVDNVSWNDCQNFILKLNKLTGKKFRLPTEAEWEYAARGGKFHENYEYSGSDDLNTVAWNWDNSSEDTHPVKTKSPNALGIYDMSGNVWEWCNDWYDENYYSISSSYNPLGPSSGEKRVMRGGSWCNTDEGRVSRRRAILPSYSGGRYGYGFRLALSR